MTDLEHLLKAVLEIGHRLSEVEHVQTNTIREGTVEQVDGKKGYQVKFGEDDGKAIPSPWFPHPEQGGAFKTWRPLTKGQNVVVICPGGDPRLAHIIPRGGFSDQNPQPSDKTDENVETYGKVRTTWKADGTKKEVGDKVKVTTTTEDHTATAGNTRHVVDQQKVLADASLFRATRKVILASG